VLPLAWFYLALVVFLYSLLLFSELRSRARRYVKGCPSLPYISPERLDSLSAIEPDVIVIELSSQAASSEMPQIPDGRKMSITQLKGFLCNASRRSIFIFYDTPREPMQWSRVEAIVNECAIPNVFVLRGGSALWLSKHHADGVGVSS
jgi:hypothetical protein